jgi:hypothetical protein
MERGGNRSMANRSFFPASDFEALCRYQPPCVSHPARKIPGLEMNRGAPGRSLPICAGMALAGKMDNAYASSGNFLMATPWPANSKNSCLAGIIPNLQLATRNRNVLGYRN